MNALKFYVPPKGGITLNFIQRCIERKLASTGRMDMLENYYKGNQLITERIVASSSTPDNKVVVNYCKVIADFFATSLTGKPIDYDSEKPKDIEVINKVMLANEMEGEDSTIAQHLNIFGVAVEQFYIDSNGEFRFYDVDPRQVIVIRDRTVEETPVCVLKVWKFCEEDEFYMVERYEDGKVTTYKYYMGNQQLENIDSKPYQFDTLPFVEIWANEYAQSTYEPILSLQDAYNKLMSLQVDEYEGFVDSFLAIYNAGGTTEDDIASMKKNRVLLLDGESKAEWIVKDGNPAIIEEIKTSIEKNIHKISMLPDLSDENFTGNSSGVAIKYKLIGSNSVLSKQQRALTELLNTRLDFIVKYLNAKGSNIKRENISFSFKSLQIDEDEINVDMIEKLYDKVPIASIVKNLSFATPDDVKTVKKADERKFSEKEEQKVSNGEIPSVTEKVTVKE